MNTQAKDRMRSTRPGSGIAVDPGRVMAMRNRRLLSRAQLSSRITDLGLRDEKGRLVTVGKDELGKYETGFRKPSLGAMRALCAVLECTADELMPGGPVITMPASARARQSRLRHNRELRDFAVVHGLRYKNPRTGRVYYSRPLREAYAAHVAAVLADGQETADEAARTADVKLAAAVAVLGMPGDAEEVLAS